MKLFYGHHPDRLPRREWDSFFFSQRWKQTKNVNSFVCSHFVYVFFVCTCHCGTGVSLSRYFLGCWAPPGLSLPTDSVCDLHGQDLQAQLGGGECQGLCRWCGSVGFIRLWPSALTRAAGSGQDVSQDLHVWGSGSLPVNGGLFPLVWDWVAAPSEELQVSNGLVHEWGQNGTWDGQADQCGGSSNVGIVPVRCGKEFHLQYVPTFTCGHELLVMTTTITLGVRTAKMSFLHRVAGLSLRERGAQTSRGSLA